LLARELGRLARTRLTMVFAVHRPEDAPAAFRRAVVMERGRIVADGPRSPAFVSVARAASGLATVKPLGRRATRASSPLVRLTAVDLYRDYRPVIRKLDWCVGAGEHWAIVGANGSGKSTLLGAIYGLVPVALGGRLERRGHPP
jgi:ABC-type molybdenum transport system ATPase subunit/photorepair protein PhrA